MVGVVVRTGGKQGVVSGRTGEAPWNNEDEDAGGRRVRPWDVLFRVLRPRESDLVREMERSKDERGLRPLLFLPLQHRHLPHQNLFLHRLRMLGLSNEIVRCRCLLSIGDE